MYLQGKFLEIGLHCQKISAFVIFLGINKFLKNYSLHIHPQYILFLYSLPNKMSCHTFKFYRSLCGLMCISLITSFNILSIFCK